MNPLVVVILFVAFLYVVFSYVNKRNQRLKFIENYRFKSSLGQKVKNKYPHLTDEDVDLVLMALREYFYICHKAKKKMVAMPSQVVDVAWHEFILFTRAYELFCKKSFGYFLHHTPTEAMKSPTLAQEGIKRAWRIACYKHDIDPKLPTHLPLIFAIDSKLGIEDGFKYSLNCKSKSSPGSGDYCAGHIGCSSGCVGSSGSDSDGGGFFGGGDSSGCGGGCGGD